MRTFKNSNINFLKYNNTHKFLPYKSFALKFRVGNDICYYKLLNIDPNASVDEIKREYYKLAKKYHPDNNEESKANQTVNNKN